jgi:hypothetical protein
MEKRDFFSELKSYQLRLRKTLERNESGKALGIKTPT